MTIYVHKDGIQYGPYSLNQLQEYLYAGNFALNDLACYDFQNWQPIAQIPGIIQQPVRKVHQAPKRSAPHINLEEEPAKQDAKWGNIPLRILICSVCLACLFYKIKEDFFTNNSSYDEASNNNHSLEEKKTQHEFEQDWESKDQEIPPQQTSTQLSNANEILIKIKNSVATSTEIIGLLRGKSYQFAVDILGKPQAVFNGKDGEYRNLGFSLDERFGWNIKHINSRNDSKSVSFVLYTDDFGMISDLKSNSQSFSTMHKIMKDWIPKIASISNSREQKEYDRLLEAYDKDLAQKESDMTIANPTFPELLTIKLEGGNVVIELYPDVAPKHVERIKKLVKQGKYDGVVFHRVIDGFMAQTGDVEFGNKKDFNSARVGTGGSELPDLKDEFNNKRHVRGTCSMARSDSNSANSQFFICLEDASFLDGKYTVWGQVIQGMDYVDKIKKGSSSKNGSVSDPDHMVKLSLGIH